MRCHTVRILLFSACNVFFSLKKQLKFTYLDPNLTYENCELREKCASKNVLNLVSVSWALTVSTSFKLISDLAFQSKEHHVDFFFSTMKWKLQSHFCKLLICNGEWVHLLLRQHNHLVWCTVGLLTDCHTGTLWQKRVCGLFRTLLLHIRTSHCMSVYRSAVNTCFALSQCWTGKVTKCYVQD